MSGSLVVDTHALLWWCGDRDQLSVAALDALNDAEALLVNPITFWEVGMLEAKNRIALDRPLQRWTAQIEALHRVTVVPLTARVCARASQLTDFHGDPADRLIVAGALDAAAGLVTRDRTIAAWAEENSLPIVW
jgi:PIN domain nuclease of toxin-antitoxin system